MKGEGEGVEGEEDAGKCLLAVARIVFEILAVGLEHIEGLVLNPRLRGDKPSTEPCRMRPFR